MRRQAPGMALLNAHTLVAEFHEGVFVAAERIWQRDYGDEQ
jgi:hypothetical protein